MLLILLEQNLQADGEEGEHPSSMLPWHMVPSLPSWSGVVVHINLLLSDMEEF